MPQLLGEITLIFPGFYVRAVEARDIVIVEHGRHWTNIGQKLLERLKVAVFEHTGLFRGRVGVVRNGIPRTEDDVVETDERYEILDER